MPNKHQIQSTALTKSSPEILYMKGKRAFRAKMEKISCCRRVAVAESSQAVFSDIYTLTKQIDSGSYSNVWEAVHNSSNIRYAVKIIDRKKLASERHDAGVYTEVNTLRYLNRGGHRQKQKNRKQRDTSRQQEHHRNENDAMTPENRRYRNNTSYDPDRSKKKSEKSKNIVKLVDFFEEKTTFYLVMEYMRGGNVFSRVMDRQYYSEDIAKAFAKCFLESVRYMHKSGVAHRDLKPDNLLLTRRGSDTEVKIGDFGFATKFMDKNGEKIGLTERCGTPAYVAPEILRGLSYDESADIWSVGAIIYFILGGYPPFVAGTPNQLFHKILKGEYEFHEGDWSHASEEAKEFIRLLLKVNPKERLTAEQALKSDWIRSTTDGNGNQEADKALEKITDKAIENDQQDKKYHKTRLKGMNMKKAQSLTMKKIKNKFNEMKVSPDSDKSHDRIRGHGIRKHQVSPDSDKSSDRFRDLGMRKHQLLFKKTVSLERISSLANADDFIEI